MSSGFIVFKNEFIDYVLSLSIVEDMEISFGNTEYDYSIKLVDKKYSLEIFDVALDHYGMPYRNTISSELVDISYLFN